MFNFEFAKESFLDLARAAPVTIYISVISILLGLFIGLIFCLIRIKKVPVLSTFIGLLISLIRSTPILVQLYVICYGIPRLNAFIQGNPQLSTKVSIKPMTVALITFTIYAACYLAEIYRSAYYSVDDGQIDAAKALNIPGYIYLIRIIIPQTIIKVLPNMSNMTIDLIKNTSLVYTISVMDVMAMGTIIAAEGFNYLEVYVDILIIYLFIVFLFLGVFWLIEKILKKYVVHE